MFGQILDIHLFVVSNFISAKTQKGHYEPLGERIDILYDTMDPESLISSEIQDRKGRTVVSCKSCRMRTHPPSTNRENSLYG